MKFFLRIAAFLLLLAIATTAVGYFFWYKPKFTPAKNSFIFTIKPADKTKKAKLTRLASMAASVKRYLKINDYNTTYCFMIDMDIAQGKQRFFIYNMGKDSIELAGLVTHGSGSGRTSDPYFSNIEGSNCTSLGKYKIGKPYQGKFGLAYKLYGLDSTNSNAFNRFVVLHAHSCVPDSEVFPLPICKSWGCPTVSPSFLQKLATYIDNSPQPVLLWIYK